MTSLSIIQTLLLLGYFFNSKVAVVKGDSCTEYNEILPHGFCIDYFQNTKIAQTKKQAIENNANLNMLYEQYIPLYVQNHRELKEIATLLISVKCGANEKIKNLIDSFKMPKSKNVEKCTGGLKKFFCQSVHPICITTERSTEVVALPCREKCIEVMSRKSCSFIKPILNVVREINKICPSFSVGSISKHGCKYYPASDPMNRINDQYCPVTESNVAIRHHTYGVKPQENKIGTMPRKFMESVGTYGKSKKLDEEDDEEDVNSKYSDICTAYSEVLPNGICKRYLKDKKIAQSKQIAVMRNKRLTSLYKIYIPMYASKDVEDIKSYFFLYITQIWEVCINRRRVKQFLDSINYPSASQLRRCSNHIKRFVCESSHPICRTTGSFHKLEAVLPCRGRCEKILNSPLCSFLKPLYNRVRKLIRFCPTFKSHVSFDSCNYFPASKTKGRQYCPIKESSDLFHYQLSNLNSEHGNKKENENRLTDNLLNMNEVEISSDGEEEEATRCVSYKSVVPSGICLQYFDNANISQSRIQLTKIDKYVGRIYMLIDNLLLNPVGSVKGNDVSSWVSEKLSSSCSNVSKIYELKQRFNQVPNMNDIRECLHGNGWFYCHIYHPKCTTSTYGKPKTSPVCRESCENIWKTPKCSFVRDLYEKIKDVCVVPYSDHIDDLFNCEKLPSLDMKHIEKCQLRNITDAPFTSSCYHGNGFNYNGAENTAGGQVCAMWSSDPYLNPEVYPSLIKNYCRNPQGYAEKPWCYIDMKTKTWTYCNVKKCTKGNESEQSRPNNSLLKDLAHDNSFGNRPSRRYHKPLNVLIVIMVALFVVGVAFTVYIYQNKKNRKIVKEYRGDHDKPDINYVRVFPTDIH